MTNDKVINIADRLNQMEVDMALIAMQVAREVRGLSVGAKGCLLMLADCYNEDYGYAFPTRAQIATEFGVTVRAVDNWIGELKAKNIIEVSYHPKYRNSNYSIIGVEEAIEERNQRSIEERGRPRKQRNT